MLGLDKRVVFALGAAAVLMVAAVGTSALAATPTPGTPTAQTGAQGQDYRQVFLTKLAAALGVDQTKLSDSIKQAETDTIDQAVRNGDLAKNPADQMKQRIQQGGPGFFGGFGGGPGGPFGIGPGFPGMGGLPMQAVEQAAADKLGMSLQDLQTQLRSGKSLSDLASAKGVSAQDVYSAMATAAKTQLDQAVKAGNLTQKQEDSFLQQIQQGQFPFFGGRPGGPSPRAMGGLPMQAVEQAAADKLGMSLQDLQTQLHSGKSLSDVAKDKGVSEQDLRSAMATAAKTQLDQAVKDGKLTQAQADSVLQRIQQGQLPGFGGPPPPRP